MRRGAPFFTNNASSSPSFRSRWMNFAAGVGIAFTGHGCARTFFSRSAAKCETPSSAAASAAKTFSTGAGGGEMIVDGVNIGVVKTPSGYMYVWNHFTSSTNSAETQQQRRCSPCLMIDFSPSMTYAKFDRPTEAAIVDAATVFQKASSSSSSSSNKAKKEDENNTTIKKSSAAGPAISSPNLIVFSGNANSVELPVNEPTTWRGLIKTARSKLTGSTRPEKAMDLFFSDVVPLIKDNSIVPLSFATDGEFNGLDGTSESYSQFWSGVSKKLAQLTEKRGLSFSFRVLGVVDDDLVHIKTMQKSLFNPETPFSYFTVKDRSEIGPAFAHTVSLALSAAGPQVRLTDEQNKKNSSQVLYENDCVTSEGPMHKPEQLLPSSSSSSGSSGDKKQQWSLENAVATAIFQQPNNKNINKDDEQRLMGEIAKWSADIADAIVRIRRDNSVMREKLHKSVAEAQASGDKRGELADLAKEAQAAIDRNLALTNPICEKVPGGLDLDAKDLPADIADRRDNGAIPPAALLDWIEAAQLDTKFIRETAETSSKAQTAKEAFEGTQAMNCGMTASMNVRMHQVAMKGAGGVSYRQRQQAMACESAEDDETSFIEKAKKGFWRK